MKRFANILFVVGSGLNEKSAFKRAVELTKTNQAKLTVVGVFNDINRLKSSIPIAQSFIDDVVKQKKREIQEFVNTVSDLVLDIEIKVFTGRAFIDVIQEVIKFKRDLLIKAIEEQDGLIETLFGSTDIKILRKCPCPVWLIKAKKQEGYKEILVGLRYEPKNLENERMNLQMLRMAGYLALAEFSELHVVHAWKLQHESILRSYRSKYSPADVDAMVKAEKKVRKQWLEEIIEKSLLSIDFDVLSYLKPQIHLVDGNADKVVPEQVKKIGAELLVMGTVARSGIAGYLIGNTAEIILNQIDCSVLAIKPEGFISPVKITNT